jgi:hypothetical protein
MPVCRTWNIPREKERGQREEERANTRERQRETTRERERARERDIYRESARERESEREREIRRSKARLAMKKPKLLFFRLTAVVLTTDDAIAVLI